MHKNLNFQESIQNLDSNAEFTYHRHSEEKNMIYFRCSDKKCKARVLFNKQTSKYTFKNSHLSPSLHKPNSKKAITGLQMARISSIVKCPISLSERYEDDAFLTPNDSLSVVEVHKVKSEENSACEVIVKVFVGSYKQAKEFCKRLHKDEMGVNQVNLYKQKNIKIFPREISNKTVVEIEVDEEKKEEVIEFTNSLLEDAALEVFRKI